MKVLPDNSFTILTPDELPIVLQRLNAQVEPTKAFRFSKMRHWWGEISELLRMLIMSAQGKYLTHKNC
ncbi:MAG: hypothetical protein V7K67_33610 [Nostoc sp.]